MNGGGEGMTGRYQGGMALVTVLWLVTLLSILAVSVSMASRGDVDIARGAVDSAQARSAAEAGVYAAIAGLLLEQPERWQGNGVPRELDFDGIDVRVTLQDEAGRIDLNVGNESLLRGLLLHSGVGEEDADRFLDAIADWKDADQMARMHGAEAQSYVNAGRQYVPRDGKFVTVEELRLVLPMTDEVFRRMRPALTVYGSTPGVNPMLAPRPVLLALGFGGGDEAVIDAYLLSRLGGPSPGVPGLSLSSLSPASGRAFSVDVTAYHPGGAVARINAIVELDRANREKPYAIREWRQDLSAPDAS